MQNAPLCKIGPGGDYTRSHLLVDPVSDDAKSYTAQVFSPEAFRLQRLHAKHRTRVVDAVGVGVFLAAGAVASWVSLPGAAWLGVGLMLAGIYVWVRDRVQVV